MAQIARMPAQLVVLAAVLDAALLTVFAAIGRGSHARAATIAGLWETAWPFLAGAALMWLVLRAWRNPFHLVRVGLPLAAGTVLVGMLLRALAGQGTALPFVIVATTTTLLFLCGWRAVAALVLRLRTRTAHASTT